jgi:hypothetical protein
MLRQSCRGSGTAILFLLALWSCGDDASPGPKKPTRIVVAGHIYSLGVANHREDESAALLDDRWLEAFADDVAEREPAAVFLLGDSTRDGSEEEWARLDRIFARLPERPFYLAGNHDLRQAANFDRRGGLRNAIREIEGRRFITLDNKCIYESHDLDFLRDALRVPEGRALPIVLMHYCMIDWRDAQPGQDPREDYPGVSNWNREVAPLLAGKVACVICGDHQISSPRRRTQEFAAGRIDYILSSFVFRRGRNEDRAGEGPNLYLELLLDGDALRILPRAVPVPVLDDWYLDPRPPEVSRLHALIDDQAWIWTTPGFEREKGAKGIILRDQSQGLVLEFSTRPWPNTDSFLVIRESLAAELMAAEPGLRSLAGGDFEVDHRPARWEWLADEERRIFYAMVRRPDQVFIFRGRAESAANGDWRELMLETLRSLKFR